MYQGTQEPTRVMRMNEDGSEQRPVSDKPIMQLQSVSPDGRWAVVGVTVPGGHGDRNVMAVAMSLDGGESFTVCDLCTFGFGTARIGSPLVMWSRDGRWLYVTLRYLGYTVGRTAAIPLQPGAPPSVIRNIKDEDTVLRIPGVRVIASEDVFPFTSPDYYVSARKSAKTNLFRIYLSP